MYQQIKDKFSKNKFKEALNLALSFNKQNRNDHYICFIISEIYNKLRPVPTEGVFHLDGKPGFGLEISTDLLDAYTVDRVIVKTSS